MLPPGHMSWGDWHAIERNLKRLGLPVLYRYSLTDEGRDFVARWAGAKSIE